MRVLQVVKTSEGASWAFDQADALIKQGVDVVTAIPDLNGKVAKKYLEKGYPLIQADFSLPIKNPFKYFKRARKIREIVKQVKPDIIHFHFVTNIIMARLALKEDKTPRVFQVPGPLHLETALFRKLDLKTARRNDFWIGSCRKTVQIYEENHVSKEKLFLGYYGGYGGVQCDEYAKDSDVLHKEYDIDNNKKIVGMVSYTYKPKWYARQKRGIKGHEDFIDALALVKKEIPGVIGVVIGGPWGNSHKYFERVKEYAKQMCGEDIIFTGTRSDVKKVYCELDVVVHPSHSENLGGAAESLAAARPTISTDVGGFVDIVKDGETGYVVPAKNPQVLSSAIIKMLKSPDNSLQMAFKGQQLVRELLDIDNTSKKILEIYREILSVEK